MVCFLLALQDLLGGKPHAYWSFELIGLASSAQFASWPICVIDEWIRIR